MTNQNSEVVELLQQAYVDELETINNYLSIGNAIDGILGKQVGDSLLDDVDEELEHAKLLANRLDVLGVTPKTSLETESTQHEFDISEQNLTVENVIKGVLTAEEAAIETYENLITAAQEKEDEVTEDLAIELLEDEQEHLSEFQDYNNEPLLR